MFWKAEGDGAEGAEESLTGLLRSMIKCTAPGHLDVVREGRESMRDGVLKKRDVGDDGSRGSVHQRRVEREEIEAGSKDVAEVGINV